MCFMIGEQSLMGVICLLPKISSDRFQLHLTLMGKLMVGRMDGRIIKWHDVSGMNNINELAIIQYFFYFQNYMV